jgi:hypothetical protein
MHSGRRAVAQMIAGKSLALDLTGRTTLMMTLVVGLFATGMVALSLESIGVTAACFGVAVLLLRFG